jgi:hypothetical protein
MAFGFPLIGAARYSEPASRDSCRAWADAATETVDASTTTPGARPGRLSSPVSVVNTARRSSDDDTVAKTTSRSPRSAMVSTTVAPSSASGTHLLRVRFHTATS